MEKINFEDGTLVSNAKVTIDNVEHEVTPAEYSGNTPLSAYTLNLMQSNIEEEIDALEKIKVSATQPTTGEDVWFRKSKNLFNYKNAVYLNAYINTTIMKIIESTSIKNHQTSYIKCASNTTYTISKSVGKSFRVGTTTDIPAIGVTINSSKANHTGTSLTITTGENDNYLVFTCFSTIDGDIGSYEEMYATVQVEEGLIATSYENYIEPSINVKNSTGGYEEFIKKEENIYSIGENKIGTWIDGKPIYRKVINWGSLPNQANVSKAHNISNLKSVISIKGIADNGYYFFPLPFVSTVVTEQITLYADKTNIKINTGGKNRSDMNAYITLKYTKTTG